MKAFLQTFVPNYIFPNVSAYFNAFTADLEAEVFNGACQMKMEGNNA
jgi:hypothetical protein